MQKNTNNLILAGVGGVLVAVLIHLLAADMDPMAQWDAFVRANESWALRDAPVIAVALAIYVFILLFGQIRINQGLIERTKADNRRRKEIENDLREALAARDGFFAAMSHDLKTPVNSILGFSEMMRTQVYGALGHEKYAEYTEDINRAANMLDLTISQILDISRLNSDDQLAVRDDRFDLMEELRFCGKLIAGWKGGRHAITISGNIPPVDIVFDRTLFRRYITNLLTNAVKYAGRDADVGIHALCTGSGSPIYLTVYDDGVGLNGSRLADAAQRYVRMNESPDAYVDSAGLGLWIVKKIAEAHDCEFSIKSGAGHGFRVIMEIPPTRIMATDPKVFEIAC
jgi:signal transduction histidine kinase